MKCIEKTIALKNGAKIPQIGLGTYKSSPEDVKDAVSFAVEAGYRHIDTATFYGNEAAIGIALKSAPVKREEIALATKLWLRDFKQAEQTFFESMALLGTEYIDLYMLHWPGTDKALMLKTYETLLKLQSKGYIKSLGASNFLQYHLDCIKEEFGEYPLFDQIEIHPWQQQKELISFCNKNGIAPVAWGPLMHEHLAEEPLMDGLAGKYDVTPAQVTLKWHLQRGYLIIPKSIHRVRIIENIQLDDFEISKEDMEAIAAIDRKKGFASDPMTFNG